MRACALFLLLAITWWLWSGHTEPTFILYGAISCLIVVVAALRIGIVNREVLPFELIPRVFLYFPYLFWEIVKSNVAVAKIILNPALPIEPRLFVTPAHQKTEFGRVVYANSITLTPGTISLDLRNGSILVQALHPDFESGVKSGDMDRRVCRIDGGEAP